MRNEDSIGKRIANARKAAGLSQAKVAENLDVSFQAVSSWERDQTSPDVSNIIGLAKLLNVSVSSLVEERGHNFKTQDKIFEQDNMASFVKRTARLNGMKETLKALDFALKAHDGQKRKNSEIPYIYHPLNMACHALAMDIKEDEIIAAILLHDVIEDCGYTKDDLPVKEETRKLVVLMTHEKDDTRREEIMKAYYKGLAEEPKAALIKCIDRCNNLTTMSWGLSREKIYRTIKETEEYVLPLLKVIKDEKEYNNAAWLLKYQIESMLDIYKRLM